MQKLNLSGKLGSLRLLSATFKKIFQNILHILAWISFFLLLLQPYLAAKSWYASWLGVYSWAAFVILTGNFIVNVVATKQKFKALRHYLFDLVVILIYYNIEILSQQKKFVYFLHFYILIRQIVFWAQSFSKQDKTNRLYRKITQNPAVFVLLTFIFTILVGTTLLLLPVSSPAGTATSFVDALFTATSATCVTGLIVVDTGTHFSTFGQLIILLLIQVGGLGLMTISTAFAILLGHGMSVQSENLMQNVVGETNRLDMHQLVKNIVMVTFFFEAVGAFFLYLKFRHFGTGADALYYAVFHSVSAFCNAGFSLYPDSLMMFKGDYLINFTVMFLIIFGGLGFSTLSDVRRNFFSHFTPKRLSLHSKLVLITTAALILLGFLGYFMAEYFNTMRYFAFKDRVLASLFTSVTTRTAGFNTIDMTSISGASVFISIILMFIGASPGSTGGGIKTTTLAVIALSALSILRGSKDVNAFRRRIAMDDIRKVLALLAIAVSFIILMVFFLLLTEARNAGFSQLLFEAVSAFGTVGLSMGITAKLGAFGKFIIIILMYLGRVGPLTLIFALSVSNKAVDITYTDEKVGIG